MSDIVLAIFVLLFFCYFSEDVNGVKILSFLFLIFPSEFSENCHQNVSNSVFLVQAKKILFGGNYLQMILSFLRLYSQAFFVVNGQKILRKLVFAHFYLLLTNQQVTL